MTMIRRATGKIESYTKQSGEVVDNIRYADNADNIIDAELESSILDELEEKQVSKDGDNK